MRLYEEFFKNADGGAFARCIIVPRGGGYFEGVKSVADFSDEKVTLRFPCEWVEVEGERLCIKKYGDGDLQLSGVITSIKVLPKGTKQDDLGRSPSVTNTKNGGAR